MHTEQEVLLVVKTLHERLPEVQRIVTEEHPFECPEFIALDITAGLPEYLKWVTSSSSPPPDPALPPKPTAGAGVAAPPVPAGGETPASTAAPGASSSATSGRGFGS